MKTGFSSLSFQVFSSALVLLVSSCSLPQKHATADPATKDGKAAKTTDAVDENDDYAEVTVADPIERFNRGMFWFNDKMYLVLARPVSKGYEIVFPKPVRRGISNVFDNAKFPVRFVNSTLQGKFKRAGQETGKFVVNTVAGVGGVLNVSDKIPALANIPAEDTGQTFAVWGVGHGAYLVLPFFGPSSVRDGVGFAGDYVLNPVNWGIFFRGGRSWYNDWTSIPPAVNTVNSLPDQLSVYDAATKEAVDPYISVRSIYVQNRADAAKK